MQLMPATARRFNVKRGYHPWDNIHGGTRYLGHLMKQYNGNLTHTVAAYNAGEGNIRPGRKIRNMGYVRKVLKAYNKFGGRKTGKPGKQVRKQSTRRSQGAGKSGIKRQQQASRNRTPQVRTHLFKVRPGDTVYEVMRQTGIPVNRIIRLNRLQAPYHLLKGQTLRLR
ncbi:MAG: transglycosylase SLT domain-containing protein, partial [Thiothrix sp.]|nr:transglycosylase SLT domain-containing protein [Thiothrix sp.]